MRKHYQKFINDCRAIVAEYGIDNARGGQVDIIAGSIENAPYRTYELDSVRITVNLHNKRMAVTLKPPLVESTNPVLCIDEYGEAYRFNGESQLAFSYADEVASGIGYAKPKNFDDKQVIAIYESFFELCGPATVTPKGIENGDIEAFAIDENVVKLTPRAKIAWQKVCEAIDRRKGE